MREVAEYSIQLPEKLHSNHTLQKRRLFFKTCEIAGKGDGVLIRFRTVTAGIVFWGTAANMKVLRSIQWRQYNDVLRLMSIYVKKL